MTYLLTFLLLLFPQTPSLDSASPKEREAAIEKMAVVGNRDAIPPLTAALKKESKSDVRAQIVAAFGRIRDKDAIPVLAETMKSDLDKDVRSQAIDSMLRIYIPIDETGPIRTIFNKVKSAFMQPDAPVVGPQVQVDAAAKQALAETMQKDFSDEVRAQAARALGSLNAKDQAQVLIAALENPQNREHRTVRVEIARTLGQLGDPAAGPALERTLRDSDKQLVAEAITSIGRVGYTAARPVLEQTFKNDPSSAIKSRSLEALALLRDKESVPLFESLLINNNDSYRELSAEGLARMKYSGAKDWRTKYEQETKPNVRNALAFGLAAAGDVDYINNLANALDSRQSSQAEVYLIELGKYEGQTRELYRYLKSTNPRVRAGVVRVLGNIGDAAATDQIRPLTDDPNTEVVREAVAALRKLSR